LEKMLEGERALGVLFLLRSIFWLTVVFTSMSWTVDGNGPPESHSGSQALGEAVAEGSAAMAHAAQRVALGQIEAHMMDTGGDKTRQVVERAALSYLLDRGEGQTAVSQAVSIQTREWCVNSDAVCARDAARLTALIVANQFDPADDSSGTTDVPAAPKRRAIVRITAR
jgi:hypothetical protein